MSRQIKKGKQKDPDDINEMPVQSGNLDRGVMPGGKSSSAREERQDQHHSDADRNVDRMQAGHGEIKPEKNLHMARVRLVSFEVKNRHQMIGPIFVILDSFQNHENNSEKRGAE